jgi:hypothetical protein
LLPPIVAEKLTFPCGANFLVWSSVVTTTATVGPVPGGVSVYEPLATALAENPEAVAMALIVVVAMIGIGFAYTAEEVVGVEPSVVK